MTRFIALSGFLGAGKTTTMVAAAKELERRGLVTAVVTNDQGTELVDTQVVRAASEPVMEVTGGCFCCRFEDLLEVAHALIGERGAQALVAEAVGSCTDLQATVIRPLASLYGAEFTVSPLTVVVEASRLRAMSGSLPLDDAESDMAYLFGKQLEEAEIIALNKVDELSPDEREDLLGRLRTQYPRASVVGYSALTGEGLGALVDIWLGGEAHGPDVDVDYDRYARAEAMLAWLNRSYHVTANGPVAPAGWGEALLGHLSQTAAERGWVIGHAKIGMESGGELTKLSVTESGGTPRLDNVAADAASSWMAQVNARVACEPEDLDKAVDAAVAHADAVCGTTAAAAVPANAFKPGYPRPVHRLFAGAAS